MFLYTVYPNLLFYIHFTTHFVGAILYIMKRGEGILKCGLFAPKYYGEFACMKGECRHSCCIGWEIDIDDLTMKKYSAVGGEIGERIRNSISTPGLVCDGALANNECDATPHFVHTCGGRCPHLDESGLCRIILGLGEDYLSDICRLHPRFFNETARGTEVGLGMSCEEAARIILSSDGYAEFISVGGAECSGCDFDVFPYRAEVYSILSDRKIRYAERLKMIGEKFSVSPSVLTDSEWGEVLSSLEYLDALSCERFACYSSDISESIWECELERALAYFVYRHSSDAKNYAEFRTGLGFAMFCERLLSSVAKAEGVGNFADFTDLARVISEEIEYSANNTDILRSEIEFAMQ